MKTEESEEKKEKVEDSAPAEPTPDEEYDKAWNEGVEGEGDGTPEGEPPAEGDEPKPDEGVPPEEAPVPDEPAPVSAEYGTVKAMEKAIKDTKAYATGLKSEVDNLQAKVKEYDEGKATPEDVASARKGVELAKGDYEKAREVLYEDYPEMKAVIEPLVEQNKIFAASNEALSKKLRANDEADEKARALKDFNLNVKPSILEEHPDFDHIWKEEFPLYDAWARMQKPELMKKAIGSNSPEDINEALTEYKAFKATGAAKVLKADEESKRKNKLSNAQSIRGGSVPPGVGRATEKGDYTTGWNEADKLLKDEGVT